MKSKIDRGIFIPGISIDQVLPEDMFFMFGVVINSNGLMKTITNAYVAFPPDVVLEVLELAQNAVFVSSEG